MFENVRCSNCFFAFDNEKSRSSRFPILHVKTKIFLFAVNTLGMLVPVAI